MPKRTIFILSILHLHIFLTPILFHATSGVIEIHSTGMNYIPGTWLATWSITRVMFALSLISLAVCYMIGCLAYLGLKKKYADMKRPYKAPLGTLGCYVTIVVYCFMLIFADKIALITAGIVSVACLIFYYVFTRKHAPELVSVEEEIGVIEEPTAEEKVKMDKVYNVWKIATIIVTVVALGIYLIPMLMGH